MARISPGNWPETKEDDMSLLRLDENLTCDECGRYGAFYFDVRKLCLDCYEACGSCCPEFGRADAADAAN